MLNRAICFHCLNVGGCSSLKSVTEQIFLFQWNHAKLPCPWLSVNWLLPRGHRQKRYALHRFDPNERRPEPTPLATEAVTEAQNHECRCYHRLIQRDQDSIPLRVES